MLKKSLKIIGIGLGILLLLIATLAIMYFSNPEGFEAKIYDRFYPKVKNEAKFQNGIQVEIPEVYELMWIACSLTDAFQKDENLTTKGDRFPKYHKAVDAYFSAYKDHPLIDVLESFFADGNYDMDHYAVRFLSLNYQLDEMGRLQKNGDYRVPDILTYFFKDQYFLMPAYLDLISDFSQKTDFKSFYAKHQTFYQKLTQNYHELADLKESLNWLESHYPNRIASYRILCSPMTGGFHNTMSFSGVSEGFEQALMYVSAPPANITGLDDSTAVRVKSGYSRIVFTEIDHNYVNPFAEQYRERIYQAIPEYKDWNLGKQGYESSMNTFLEYMTWGKYSLFAMNQFEGWEYDYAISRVENMMAEYRGFHEFPAFNQELIQYYRNQEKPFDMHQLYEHMLDWMETYSKQIAQSKTK